MKIKLNSKASFKSPQLFQKKTSERKIGEKTCPLEKCEIHKHYINRSKSFSAYFDILSILQTFYVFFSRLFFLFRFYIKNTFKPTNGLYWPCSLLFSYTFIRKRNKNKMRDKISVWRRQKKKIVLNTALVFCSFM